MSGVTLERVTKTFGQVRALDDVSFDIESGEMLALLGPSGCGKTTLLRSVAGLEKPTSGRIVIAGRDVTFVPTRERPIGMVFQSYALFPNLSVRQNIAFPLEVRQRPAAEVKSRVDELLELVRLVPQADRYPNQISGGQAQRCALGRALAPSPEVLLLDEPLSALDALVRTRLRDEIRRVQQLVKTTAIYVTHDQSEAMAIADRVAVMNHGRVEQIASPPVLYESPSTSFSATFVGSRNALELPVRDGRVGLGGAFEVAAPVGALEKAVVFFRPEDVEVSADGPGHPATVEIKIFLGSITRLHLVTDIDGVAARFYADLPSRQANAFPPETKVSVRVDPADLKAFSAEGRARVLLIGLDGFSSRHVTPALAPNLVALAAEGGGTAPDGGRTALPSTTYPGFASLLTARSPTRHGVRTTAHRAGAVPGWAGGRSVGAGAGVPTLFDACRAAGLRSAAVLGDHKLHAVLGIGGVADRCWPASGRPGAEVERDAHGYPANAAVRVPALAAVLEPGFDFVFVHLNEVDTLGHDLGPEATATLAGCRTTDALVGELLAALRGTTALWARTVVIVASDHAMDARRDASFVHLRDDPAVRALSRDEIGDGGAALIQPERGVDPGELAALVAAHEAVASIEILPDGIVVAGARPGRAFTPNRHPRPGTFGGVHGGPATIRTVALVGGGGPTAAGIGTRIADPARPPRLVDLAATIADLLAVRLPDADGVALLG